MNTKQEYTHKINWMGTELRCFIYKNVKEKNEQVYIRTEDNRACWWNKIILLK